MTTPNSSRLFKIGAVLVICLAIFASVSSSRSTSSNPKGRAERATAVAPQTRDIRSALKINNNKTGADSLLPRLTQPVALPGTHLLSLLAPQAPAPETIATYADDCTTPKTDFNFGDTICVVVSNARVGANERLVWGHTDGFLAREVPIN